MKRNIKNYILNIGLSVLLAGCVTTTPVEYGTAQNIVDLDTLEGVWVGYGECTHGVGYTDCNVTNLPVKFIVRNGRGISLCTDPRCSFDVPIAKDGTIKFRYKKAGILTSDYPGSRTCDITFKGRLFENSGEGTFQMGICSGTWNVKKR